MPQEANVRIDTSVDYSVVAFVTCGSSNDLLVTRDGLGKWRFPSGSNHPDEFDEIKTLARILRDQIGVSDISIEHMNSIGVEERSILRGKGRKKRLYHYSVLLFQVAIDIEQFLNRREVANDSELTFLAQDKITGMHDVIGYHRYLFIEHRDSLEKLFLGAQL